MMDSAIDVIPSVLKFLGKNPDSNAPDDLAAVERALMAIRPYIRAFASGGALEALATGQTCLAFDYSGDVTQAASRAEEAKRGVTVRYVAPKEGVEVGFDMLAIPADAPHKDAALAFIDFVLRPESDGRHHQRHAHYPNAMPASAAAADGRVGDPVRGRDGGVFHHRSGPRNRRARPHTVVGPVQGGQLNEILRIEGLTIRFWHRDGAGSAST